MQPPARRDRWRCSWAPGIEEFRECAAHVLAHRVGFTLGDAISLKKPEAAQQMRNNASDVQLDSIGQAILDVLQHEGRISNQELAQRAPVAIGLPGASRRWRIRASSASYVALLNAKAVGKHGISYTILNLESMSTPRPRPSSRRCATRLRSSTATRGRRERLPDPLHLPRRGRPGRFPRTQVLMHLPAWRAPTRCWCCAPSEDDGASFVKRSGVNVARRRASFAARALASGR